MGCGIARFGRRGLKTTETWKFWSQNLSPGVLRHGAPGVSRHSTMGFWGAAQGFGGTARWGFEAQHHGVLRSSNTDKSLLVEDPFNIHIRSFEGSPCRYSPSRSRQKLEGFDIEPHPHLALFDMPNLNRFDILSISIFCKIALSISLSISIFSKLSLSISISIFFKFADISTIDINIRYFIDKSGGKQVKIGWKQEKMIGFCTIILNNSENRLKTGNNYHFLHSFWSIPLSIF